MLLDRLAGPAIAAGVVARGLLRRRQTSRLAQRLASLPATAPTVAPISIHWTDHQVPFIEAASEPDLAVGLGIVHAHLRLGQMEILRRVAQGRIAEMIGPLGIELDRTIRLMDVSRAVPATEAGLPDDVRAWAGGFVRGVNHLLAGAELPEEMRLLGIGREPWTMRDLLVNARLAAADITWFVYARLLREREKLPRDQWRALWPRLLASGMPNPEAAPLGVLARAGSNAAAVAGWRSASGAALLAADPHLSVALPNVWVMAGMSCPTINATGLMPTGFPIVAIGRNRSLAWAGTSLHAAATDLFDVSDLPIGERAAIIRVRGGGTRTVILRESPLGPVVSDGLLYRHPTPLALRWVGHLPSDELGAMLAVLRAQTPAAFAAAMEGFAVPGQNMVYATADGRIGHVLALRAPRHATIPDDLVRPASDATAWQALVPTSDFPARHDPASGVVASGNDEPPHSGVLPGYFYSPPDRMRRLRQLLEGDAKVDLAAMAATQVDARGQRDVLDALLARLPPHPMRDVLARWDGGYDLGSRGAVVFEAMLAELVRRLPDQARLLPLSAVWIGRGLIVDDALAMDDEALRPILRDSMDRAARMLRRHRTWGAMHRMRLRHYLGAVPVLGWRYRYGEYASPGGNDTLNKTGHGPVHGRHAVSYGASARFVTDMADPDASRAVLLGGQDGWVGSDTFADQVALWRRGEYLDLPLRPETARQWPHHTVLQPCST